MKIEYITDDSDKNYNHILEKEFYECNATDTYRNYIKDTQLRWSKLRALKMEYLKVYSEQACITTPKNELGFDEKSEWGVCLNSGILFSLPANLFTCSVGMVRKMRNNVPDDIDTGTCKSCPYFIPRDNLESRTIDEIKTDIEKNH